MKPGVAATAVVLCVVLVVSLALLLRNMLTVKTYEPQVTSRRRPQNRLSLTGGALSFPVDVVFTWCQETPERAALLKQYKHEQITRTKEGKDRQAPTCTGECEIHYAVKSVQRFMPWVNNIFVLTQRPQDPNIPGTTVVFHDQLVTDPAILPTFNSHAIESFMHLIPRLAEHFIYFNDDMMVGRPLEKSTFYMPDGKPILYSVKTYSKAILPQNGWQRAWNNLHTLWKHLYPAQPVRQLFHQATAMTKHLCIDSEAAFSSLYHNVRRTRLRDVNNVPPVALALLHGVQKGVVEVKNPDKHNILHMLISRASLLSKVKKVVETRPHFFCLNYITSPDTWVQASQHLDALFASPVVPKKLWQTWHSLPLPPKMQDAVNALRRAHPDFEHVLMDINQCAAFIRDNFDADVARAFHTLIPLAYKADLWRLCVLYAHGGVYVDVKFRTVNSFSFHPYLHRSHFVQDRPVRGKRGLCNACIIAAPGDARLYNAIQQIVTNVNTKYYGTTTLHPTGPQLLAKFVNVTGPDVTMKYVHHSLDDCGISDMKTGQKLLQSYPEYRAEQRDGHWLPRYSVLWDRRSIYKPDPSHMAFVEIGTSDFDTLIEKAGPDTHGLSVEPIGTYLDRLPNKPHVHKLQQAVSDHNGFIYIYYLRPEIIKQLKLPHWIRGCNSVNKPHQTVMQELRKRKIGDAEKLFQVDKVCVTDVATLLAEQNVLSIDLLKLDTEGHDCTILRSLLQACQTNPNWWPRQIKFESNQLSDPTEVSAVCDLFARAGYGVQPGYDTVLTRSSSPPSSSGTSSANTVL